MKDLVSFLHQYGYLFIFFILAIEGTGMPGVPIWLVFLESGYLIEKGQLNFLLAIVAAITGNIMGNLIGYSLGVISHRIIKSSSFAIEAAEPSKRKKRRFWSPLSRDDLNMIEGWFSRYGALTIFISRWFGIIRTPSILAAGFTGMDIKKYAVASFFAASTWSLAWQLAAWKLGDLILDFIKANPRLLKYYVNPEIVALLVVIAMASGYIGWRFMKGHGYK